TRSGRDGRGRRTASGSYGCTPRVRSLVFAVLVIVLTVLREPSRRRRLGLRPAALDPPLEVALRPDGHRQGPRGDVFADDRAGGRIGAVADRHGGDEHRVRARPHVRTDLCAVLL